MKTSALIVFVSIGCAAAAATAESNKAPEPPVPVVQAPSPIFKPAEPIRENQRLYGHGQTSIVTPEAAAALLERFRSVYRQPNAPRLVIYVNRELVDLTSGMKLTGHTENYEKTETKQQSDISAPSATGTPQTQINVAVGGGAAGSGQGPLAGTGSASTTVTKTSGENTYRISEHATPSLADRQTVREVERLFGRVFRHAGAHLADQNTAALLLEEERGLRLASDRAAKDREALAKVADVAIEVLISSRNLAVPGVAGDQSYPVPDIQATAIRLKDAAILGQASASDVLGKDRDAGPLVQTFDAREITEATALALMEDMLLAAP